MSGNTAYNQSSAIYSDLNSEIFIDKVYFIENRCVRLSCKIIYSPKKELLDDIYSFKEYVFPILCFIGIALLTILLIIPIFELARMIRQRAHFNKVVWGDIIFLWLLGAIAIYRPYQTVPRPYNWAHRTLIIVVLIISCVIQGMQSFAVMPEVSIQLFTILIAPFIAVL